MMRKSWTLFRQNILQHEAPAELENVNNQMRQFRRVVDHIARGTIAKDFLGQGQNDVIQLASTAYIAQARTQGKAKQLNTFFKDEWETKVTSVQDKVSKLTTMITSLNNKKKRIGPNKDEELNAVTEQLSKKEEKLAKYKIEQQKCVDFENYQRCTSTELGEILSNTELVERLVEEENEFVPETFRGLVEKYSQNPGKITSLVQAAEESQNNRQLAERLLAAANPTEQRGYKPRFTTFLKKKINIL